MDERNTRWKHALLVPAATASLLLLAACGPGGSVEPDAPEPEVGETEPADTQADPAEEGDAETQDGATEDGATQDGGSEEEPADGVLTMAEVEQNDSPDSCWAVMNGTVYDLTDWIDQHPGGADRIEGLCGTDAADDFAAQHGGQDGPEGQLAEFEIGTLED